MPITTAEVVAISKLARNVTNAEAANVEFINDEEEDAPRPPEIPVRMLFIGNFRLRDVVSSISNMKDSSWSLHIVHYQPSVCAGFKKSDLDSSPHVTLSLSYLRALDENDLFSGFKKFRGIEKPLDWCHACPARIVNWNDG